MHPAGTPQKVPATAPSPAVVSPAPANQLLSSPAGRLAAATALAQPPSSPAAAPAAATPQTPAGPKPGSDSSGASHAQQPGNGPGAAAPPASPGSGLGAGRTSSGRLLSPRSAAQTGGPPAAAGATAIGDASPASRPSGAAASGLQAPPLDLDLLRSMSAGRGGSASEAASGAGGGAGQGPGSDVALAAGLLLARVEATAPSGGLTNEDKYRRALLMALEEHQRLQSQIRSELAAARALAAEAKQAAEARDADVQAAAARARQAEVELGRARAEALAAQQHAQRMQVDLEEHREARDEELTRARAAAEAAATALQEQSSRARKAVEESAAEASAARAAAAALQRELAVAKRHLDQERSRLEAQAAALRSSLEAERAAAEAARAERDRAVVALQAAEAARKAAEESERKALRAAAKQAEMQVALSNTAAAAVAARQRVASAGPRAAAVRAADPVAAVMAMDAPGSEQPAPASSSARPGSAAAGIGGSPRPASASRAGPSPAPSPARAAQQTSGSPGGGSNSGGSGGGSPAQGPGPPGRAEGHRSLLRGLAVDRAALGELAAASRRAAAAAEREDARVAESALSAAPEHLRALGLAFRAYIVAAPAPDPLGSAQAGSAKAPPPPPTAPDGGSSPAAALAARLSSAGYRVYLDPLTVTAGAPPLLQVPSTPLVSLSAAVVVLASPGLLRRPLARGELAAAARHGCPLVVLSPPGLALESLAAGEEPTLLAGNQPDAMQLAMDALREAWPSRLELPPDAPAAAVAVAARLGLTDAQLALLPQEALRHLAVARCRAIPDLRHLNVLPPLAAATAAATGSGGMANASGAGLQHLRLNFAAAPGGAGPLADLLLAVLAGNTSLTALTLRGCPASAARAITDAVLASPVSRVSYVAISSRVPLAHLAGRVAAPGAAPPPAAISLGSGTSGGGRIGGGEETAFTDEDAEVVMAALRARAAAADGPAAAQPLSSLSLPVSCNLTLGSAAVEGLAAALAELPGLNSVNGVVLQAAASSAATAAGPGGRGGGVSGGGVLDLSGSRCGPVVLALLLRRLQTSLPSLTALNLTGCEVGPAGAALLAAAAASEQGGAGLAALQTACLADNGLGPEALARRLPALGSQLAVLALSHNAIGSEGGRALAAALAQPACPELRELLLPGNQLGDAAARELAGALGKMPGLQALHLSDNPRIGPDGLAGLAGCLAALPALTELDLARASAGNEGARHIAKALSGHPSLTSLSLDGCKIRAEGAAHLAAALGGFAPPAVFPSSAAASTAAGPSTSGPVATGGAPSPLAHLGLSRNQLGDRGAAALAEGLARNRGLTSLDLRGNGIGLTGLRALAAALRARSGGLGAGKRPPLALALSGNELEEEEVAQVLGRIGM
ncbi:hypothetical protein GPECTOR_43g901 [Gonium pectorale]|uniref:Uncharacterized protein n=1 Tax=Gonium pectorale TaxID=33097 RepID=A0A150GA70_GONPE|nr:hypothetical protein GPECTOR_43g901 [Gonium pectorale]|eukprot:KXZ46465.1 hypothetical protein GPECTOR_43g901 [Gonium pectorale]